MLPVGFEPTILPSARLQTYALDRATTGIGCIQRSCVKYRCLAVYPYVITVQQIYNYEFTC
jgi:hypothetical protein